MWNWIWQDGSGQGDDPLIESHCKYIECAKYEDEITIKPWIEEMSGAKVIFNYSAIRSFDKKILATGSTVHVFVDEKFRIINIMKKGTEIWGKLQILL